MPTPSRDGIEDATIDQLRRANDALQTFVRAVSHDLRRPLTAVKGCAELLEQRGDQLTVEQRLELLRRLQVATDEMDRMIEELLDADRTALDAAVQRRPVDVAQLLRDIAARHASIEPSAALLVDGNSAQAGPTIHAPSGSVIADVDPVIVTRIVDNLVHNAVTHTPPQTPISVDVRHDGGELILTVSDEGPGIPDERRHRIFEPFVSFGDDRESSTPTRGVGLALVQRLTALHGGSAHLAATDGGTRFVVTLPSAH